MPEMVKFDPESELGRQLSQAAARQELLRVEIDGVLYDLRIQPSAARHSLPYRDPARIRQGLAASAGMLSDIDVDALKDELREARGHDMNRRAE